MSNILQVPVIRSLTSPAIVLLTLLAVAEVVAAKDEYPWLAKSVWWKPYRWSTEAAFLLHFDEIKPYGDPESLFLKRREIAAANADSQLLERDQVPKDGAPRTAANAKPMAAPGLLIGDAALCEDGRFGGGLCFPGGDGALQLAGQKWNVDRTVEFWVKPTELPRGSAVLFQALRTKHPEGRPATLELMSDGSLRFIWLDKPSQATEKKLKAGEWAHVAFRYAGKWGKWAPLGKPMQAQILINGEDALSAPITPDVSNFSATPQDVVYWIGNDSTGKRGFHGTIDELRFSESVQEYFKDETAWTDPERPLKPVHKHPFLRDDADLIMHLPFDGALQAARSAPGTKVVRSFEPEGVQDESDYFLPAVAKQGMILGEGGLAPTYQGEGNIDMAHGSIAFWMRPLDWDNLTRFSPFDKVGQPSFINLFHVVGDFPEDDGPERWKKGSAPILRFVVFQNMQQDVVDPPEISPARWIHMTVTWDKDNVRYYVDGRQVQGGGPVSPFTIVTPDNDYWIWGPPGRPSGKTYLWRTNAQSIVFSGFRGSLWHPYWYLRAKDPHTLIDDFRVYRRALAPAEIANLFAMCRPESETKALPVADMEYKLNGQLASLDAEAFPFMQDYMKIKSACFSLRLRGQEKAAAEKTVAFDPMEYPYVHLNCKPLDFATYDLTADFQDASGAIVGKVSREIVRQKPPWWGNRHGLSDKVMPEWDPMKVSGSTVSVALRDIHLGASGFPARIVSKGEDMLVKPISVEAAAGGSPIALTSVKQEVLFGSANDVRADWEGRLSGGGIELKTKAYMEFDGMMWFAITVGKDGSEFKVQEDKGTSNPETRPLKPVLSSLTIRIPFNPRDAELLHWYSGNPIYPPYRKFPSNVFLDATPAGKGVVFSSNDTKTVALLEQQRGSFIPYLCLMGMERGMAFFGENDRGWTPTMKTPALAVERTESSVDLVLNLISEPVNLSEPRVIEFGLHPLPLRKLRPDWRAWPGWGVPMDCGLKGDESIWNSLLPLNADWSKVAERWKSDPKCARPRSLLEEGWAAFRKDFGRDPSPYEKSVPGVYTVLPYPGWVPEHTREFHEIWWSGNVKGAVPDSCFVDFSAWCWHNWVETGVVEGFYVDGDFMGVEIADRGNLAYALPDGHVQPGFGWRHVREHQKRMRQILWDHNIVPHICNHMTNSPFAPIESFVDVMLDGEWEYQSPPDQRDFLDVWPPARMRISHIGKWNVMPKWLGWTVNPPNLKAWTYRHDRAYFANLGVHDIDWLFWGRYSGLKDAQELRIREPETEFVGYWTERNPAKHEYGENLLVSAWKAPARDGKNAICTVILVNRGDKRLEPAVVRFDTSMMGLGDNPDAVAADDVDPLLLDPVQYGDDPTTTATSDVKASGIHEVMDDKSDEMQLEEPETAEAETEDGKKKHPDYAYSWAKGELRCAVRRHDYRLFRFRQASGEARELKGN